MYPGYALQYTSHFQVALHILKTLASSRKYGGSQQTEEVGWQ